MGSARRAHATLGVIVVAAACGSGPARDAGHILAIGAAVAALGAAQSGGVGNFSFVVMSNLLYVAAAVGVVCVQPPSRKSGRSCLSPSPSHRLRSAMLGTLVTEAGLLFATLVTGSLTARLLLPEGARGPGGDSLLAPAAGRHRSPEHPRGHHLSRRQPVEESASRKRTGHRPLHSSSTAGQRRDGGRVRTDPAVPDGRRALQALATLSQVYLLTFIPFHFVASALYASDQGELRFHRVTTPCAWSTA